MQTLSAYLIIFEIIVLIFSIIIHEISHGYVAELLGDPTARLQGRLTLNPLKHIDFVGSILVPLVTFFTAGFAFGWAKPVPFNPYNLKNRRSGELLIALAGPFSNFLIAFVFGMIIRFGLGTSEAFFQLCAYIVLINLSLGVFNLIPFPPLDGSKIIFVFFPQNQRWMRIRRSMEQYSIFLLLILVIFLWSYITPIIPALFVIFTGFQL